MTAEALHIRPFQPTDAEAVVALWRACDLTRRWNDPGADIERKLADSPDLFLVGVVSGRVVASVMAGYDGHRGWMNYLAVDPAEQGHGYGRTMVAGAEERLLAHGCAKVNLQIRAGNLAARGFYEALGYAQDPVVSYGKRLISDE